eukprot:TRINITY_DN17196_c0_g1_i1.p1 TRINITY_DN17196_c0_g1~~TRINITY_DN17196_c0_g1_i1.p1  ORF type:complete len:424 (-),score=55.92 TRINITY_DN17196_c0_g1_i1:176-1447(-)
MSAMVPVIKATRFLDDPDYVCEPEVEPAIKESTAHAGLSTLLWLSGASDGQGSDATDQESDVHDEVPFEAYTHDDALEASHDYDDAPEYSHNHVLEPMYEYEGNEAELAGEVAYSADADIFLSTAPLVRDATVPPPPPPYPPEDAIQPTRYIHDGGFQQCWNPSEYQALADPSMSIVKHVEERTTVMLRNVPHKYTSTRMVNLINAAGFKGAYDFMYLPMDFDTNSCLGFCFVNLIGPAYVWPFWTFFDGFSDWKVPSRNKCSVSWSSQQQGLEANIERYRNSPVMRHMPDACKPRLFHNGERIPFPPPSGKVRSIRRKPGAPAPANASASVSASSSAAAAPGAEPAPLEKKKRQRSSRKAKPRPMPNNVPMISTPLPLQGYPSLASGAVGGTQVPMDQRNQGIPMPSFANFPASSHASAMPR